MAGSKRPWKRANTDALHQCGLCEKFFADSPSLQQHMLFHGEVTNGSSCEVCNKKFDDQLALEQHKIYNQHNPPPHYICNRCDRHFPTSGKLDEHRRFPSPCHESNNGFNIKGQSKGKVKEKAKAPNPKTSREGTPAFPLFGQPQFLQQPTFTLPPDPITVYSMRASSVDQSNKGDTYCEVCKRTFLSRGSYNNHFMGCRPPDRPRVPEQSGSGEVVAKETRSPAVPSASNEAQASSSTVGPEIAQPKLPKIRQEEGHVVQATNGAERIQPQRTSVNADQPHATADTSTSFPHQATSTMYHEEDMIDYSDEDIQPTQAPANANQARDKDPVMTELVRSRVREIARLRETQRHEEAQGRRPTPAPTNPTPTLVRPPAQTLPQTSAPPAPPSSQILSRPPTQVPQHLSQIPRMPPAPTPASSNPTGTNVGGLEDMDQAEDLHDKIIRLRLQADVLIHHTGKITYDGMDWTRVSVARQATIAPLFHDLCALPLAFQEEYLPAPHSFADEHKVVYPAADFQPSPVRSDLRPVIEVVAISCVKIVMSDGCQEAVKFAAVDVTTSRILINNFICMEPTAPVRDWRRRITGLTGFGDMEIARQTGYKIFKGWEAARKALWKFIDKTTIIVGHNLRTDLDALRMVHGRAVDVAKLIEKAAGRNPVSNAQRVLSKQQLSLDSMCRDLPHIDLPTHPVFGRDALQNAFAARELVLWKLKNETNWTRWAKEKAFDYERINPTATN